MFAQFVYYAFNPNMSCASCHSTLQASIYELFFSIKPFRSLSRSTRQSYWGNRAIETHEIFKNMFICYVQVTIIFPSLVRALAARLTCTCRPTCFSMTRTPLSLGSNRPTRLALPDYPATATNIGLCSCSLIYSEYGGSPAKQRKKAVVGW